MVKVDKKISARTKQYGEVMTPDKLVNQILNKLSKHSQGEAWKRGKTFLDNSCGTGNFLIHILWRKIARGHKPLEALSTVYGADIQRDSIRICRMRLLKLVSLFEEITEEHIKVVFKNIVWINHKVHPTGSLEYNFSFKNSVKQADVDRWMKYIHQDHVLNEVELPVSETVFVKSGQVDLFADSDNPDE